MSALDPAPFDWADLAPDPDSKPCPAGVYQQPCPAGVYQQTWFEVELSWPIDQIDPETFRLMFGFGPDELPDEEVEA